MAEKPTYEKLEQRKEELERELIEHKRTQEALRENEEKYRMLLENISEGFVLHEIITDELGRPCDFRFLEMNAAYERLTGLRRTEMIGRCVREIATELPWIEHYGKVALTGEPEHFQDFSTTLNRWFEVFAYQTKPGQCAAIFTDITEHKKAIESQQESEGRYRRLFEYAPYGILIADSESYYTDANPSLCRMLGYTRDEFIGLHASDIVASTEIQHIEPALEEIKTTSEYFRVWQFRRKDGSVFNAEVSVTTLPDGHLLGTIHDITERQRAEEGLRESEKKLRLFIEHAPAALAMFDNNMHYLAVSRRWMTDYRLADQDVIGRSHYEIFPEIPDRWKAMHQRGLAGEVVQAEEDPFERLDGSIQWLHWVIRPWYKSDNSVGGIVIFTSDLTERRQMEEERVKLLEQLNQAQKMEAIGTLAGGIAHDFNNILSAIIGFTEISLENVEKDSKLYDNLQEVFRAGRRAKDLVKHILTFSRQTDVERKPVQAKFIVEEALKFTRASLPTTIEIRQDIQSDSMILADATHVNQILMNLCTNAGQAMKDKGGVLEIKIEDVDLDADFTNGHLNMKPGTFLKLTVSDTGAGMPPQILERIFDPFFTTKEPEEGTGMGLSTVHGIVGSYGGAIKANSEPGQGSTFEIYLPIIELRKEPEMMIEEPIPTGSECILFVDDEPALADLGKQILESLGYEVIISTSSIKALELFKAHPNKFDLIITDMTMPQMTGAELAQQLIKIRPKIPVILCTGYSSKVIEPQFASMSYQAFFMKPIVKREMAITIREVLDQMVIKESGSTA